MKHLFSRANVVHIHRTIAIISVIIILFTAISGFLLQHAEDFNWQNKSIQQDWILDIYDVKTSTPLVYPVFNKPKHFAIQLAHQWYINNILLPYQNEAIRSAAYIEPFWVIASDSKIYLYSDILEAIESIPLENLDGLVTSIYTNNNRLLIQTQSSTYQADKSLLSFEKIINESPNMLKTVAEIDVSTQSLKHTKSILDTLPKRVSDIRYLRLMQDLHGGRLFGLPHWFIPDLTAFSLIFLSLSGLIMKWQRRPRKKN